MTNKEKWIENFRQTLVESGIDESRINDEDLEQMMKGMMAPQLCEDANIKYEWQYELFWHSLINFMEPPESAIGSIDAEMFKNNLNEN